jgi:hypothetical protein
MAGLEQMLFDLGYRLTDDAWESDGRRTYIHDDDADRTHLKALRQALGILGWSADRSKLRSFSNAAGEEIEVEPGGSDVTGHFLHHMKAVTS